MSITKFWLVQIVMVFIVSLVLGSPVWADDDDDDGNRWHEKSKHDDDDDDDDDGNRWHQKWKHDDDDDDDDGKRRHQKWNHDDDDDAFNDAKWHAKLEKWLARKMDRRPGKSDKWQHKYDRKLARHNANYHASDPVPAPASEPEPTCTLITQLDPATGQFIQVCA